MDLVTTNTRIEELQQNLTNVNLLDDDDLTYDGGDVQENSTIYEETKLFSKSNCFSSDSTICDLTEPFEFSEAADQKKIGDNYLRIGESEITMLFAEESDNEVTSGYLTKFWLRLRFWLRTRRRFSERKLHATTVSTSATSVTPGSPTRRCWRGTRPRSTARYDI